MCLEKSAATGAVEPVRQPLIREHTIAFTVYPGESYSQKGNEKAAEVRRPDWLKDGGADRDRTCDTHNAIVVLYQLSYDPIQSDGQIRLFPSIVKTFCGNF